ncbi:MAG: hypothetical protein IT252_04645 [Chitinophagaceae bacterium]|nr:hypothetical protein [Chitinophagaceae bacterium]
MKQLLSLLIAGLIMNAALAQQFIPAPSKVQTRLEASMKRFGNVERMFVKDTQKPVLELTGGNKYVIAFAYKTDSKTTRRMLVHEIGAKGEKMKLQYPEYSKGYRGVPGMQVFHVLVAPDGDATTLHKYKIDADDAATVYIYKLIPGVNN